MALPSDRQRQPAQQPQLLARVLKEAMASPMRKPAPCSPQKISRRHGHGCRCGKVLRDNPPAPAELPPRSELYRKRKAS